MMVTHTEIDKTVATLFKKILREDSSCFAVDFPAVFIWANDEPFPMMHF